MAAYPLVKVARAKATMTGLLVFMVLLAMQKTAGQWFGAVVELLRRTTVFGVHIFGWLANAIVAAVGFVEDVLGQAALRVEALPAAWLGGLAAILDYAAFTTAYVAESALDALHTLRHAVIPRLIRAATLPLRLTIHGVHSVAHITIRELHAAEAALEADLRVALRAAQTALATAEGALDAIPSLDIPGAVRSLWRRLSRVEKLVIGGALAGAVVRVLARSLPWYRCSNVNKAARGMCRMNTDLLDALLLGTVVIAGSVSLREFVHECQSFEPEVEAGLRFFIRELHNVGG